MSSMPTWAILILMVLIGLIGYFLGRNPLPKWTINLVNNKHYFGTLSLVGIRPRRNHRAFLVSFKLSISEKSPVYQEVIGNRVFDILFNQQRRLVQTVFDGNCVILFEADAELTSPLQKNESLNCQEVFPELLFEMARGLLEDFNKLTAV